MLVSFLIIVPILAAISSLLVKKKTIVLECVTAAAVLIEFISVISIVLRVADTGDYVASDYFRVDPLGAIVLLIIATVGLCVSFYSISYLRQEVIKEIIGFHRVRQYFVLLHLFLLAMFFAVMSTNPIMMWIAVEATTLSTAFLISFYNKASAMEAAWKYLIINSVGLMLGFFGTLLFFTPVLSLHGAEVVRWDTMLASAGSFNPFLSKVAFIFILVGYGTKMGLVPMHTWLPDAHSKAPVPISSLLSGVLLNVAFLAILRFKLITDHATGAAFSQNLLIFFGLVSIIVAAFIIFIQKNYKRLLAYSSIEHMGIMALGFGFGGIGVFASLLHMIYHSLAKSILFLSAGNIFLKYSSTKIVNVRGALSALPMTSVAFLIGFLAITGVPPFGLFLTETYILLAGMAEHPVLVSLALLALVLVFSGFLKHIHAMVLSKKDAEIPSGEFGIGTLAPLAVLVIFLILLGFFIPAPLDTLLHSVASMYSGAANTGIK